MNAFMIDIIDEAQSSLSVEMGDLKAGEQLVIWAARRWIAGLGGNAPHLWSQVWNSFARNFGAADGKSALCGLATDMKVVHLHARRKFRYYPPCCKSVSSDELSYLAFVAACQAKNWMLARNYANWLLHIEGVGEFLAAGQELSLIFSRHGLPLSPEMKSICPGGEALVN